MAGPKERYNRRNDSESVQRESPLFPFSAGRIVPTKGLLIHPPDAIIIDKHFVRSRYRLKSPSIIPPLTLKRDAFNELIVDYKEYTIHFFKKCTYPYHITTFQLVRS